MPPLPWFKYYPNDFFNDPTVLEMTDEEVGFYQRMLWRAWEQELTGSLPTSIETLARLLHRDRRKVQRMLGGLVGQCWVEKDGRLWNPRLAHEAQKQQVKSAKAKSSIGERWRKQRDTNVLPSKNQSQSQSKSKIKDKIKIKVSCAPNGAGYPEDFLEFWNLYPRKKSKDRAFRAWVAVTKKTPPKDIIDGLKRNLSELESREPQYVPHCSTWLNSGGWKDEPDQQRKRAIVNSGTQAFLDVASSLRGKGSVG